MVVHYYIFFFFFSSRRRHTRFDCDWSSDVCSSDLASGRRLGIDWWAIGDGFTWNSRDMERTEAIAREAWFSARELIRKGEHDLVVLDEITYPLNWGWIDADDVLETIRTRPPHVNLVATGRDAPAGLCEIADTVT